MGVNAPADTDMVETITNGHLTLVGNVLTINFSAFELNDELRGHTAQEREGIAPDSSVPYSERSR